MANLVSQDFTMFSGDDENIQFSITDENGAAADITAATATWSLSRKAWTSTIVSKTVGSGITITDGLNGLLLVTLDQADTDPLQGDYYHELEIVEASGKKTTAAHGTVTINHDHI